MPAGKQIAEAMICGVLCLAASLQPAVGSDENGGLDLRVRDSDAGTGIAAHVVLSVDDGTRQVLELSRSGFRPIALPPGKISLEARAPGYAPLTTHLSIRRGQRLPLTLWLDPLEVRGPCSVDHVASRMKRNWILVHGHVVDGATGAPVGDALVRLEPSAVSTRTDVEGHFELQSPVPIYGADELPETGYLIVESSGFKRYLQRGFPMIEGNAHVIVDLQPGRGDETVAHDGRHKLQRVQNDPVQDPGSGAGKSYGGRPRVRVPVEDRFRASPTAWTPPASIRVGFDCSCTACSSVQALSLETYVKRGLNDEWIASWVPHSLQAGSIPYRAYGVWHVNNPLDDNYDICSTTCCQVNDADTSLNTDAAVERTTGILVESAGTILRAEYSAENNGWDDPGDGLSCSNIDLSCGNGFAGSPAAGWPCLPDSPGSGHGCFGHGRGMCQWGTQRWADSQGQLWNWIVDHYYNDNDNPSGLRSGYITSPLQILDATPDVVDVEPGAAFQINLDVRNFAASDHSQILIGASLSSLSTGYIDDPGNDQPVSLPPGDSSVSRTFQVPVDAPPQPYDIIAAVWIDVDGDGAISGLDQPMATHTAAAAVEVCSEPVSVGTTLLLTPVAPAATDAVELSWQPSPNATSYAVYRSNDPASGLTEVGTTSLTTYVDTTATASLLFYRIFSRNACGESGF